MRSVQQYRKCDNFSNTFDHSHLKNEHGVSGTRPYRYGHVSYVFLSNPASQIRYDFFLQGSLPLGGLGEGGSPPPRKCRVA